MNLSMENIARMSNISLRQGAVGFLTLVTGICGIFLFSSMSADEINEKTITVVGLIGLGASFGIVVSEIYSSLKAQKTRFELTEGLAQRRRILQEPVEEVSEEELSFCVKRELQF